MYYCKHCGVTYVSDEGVICVRCGAPKGAGNNYCHSCGKPMEHQARICLNCGVDATMVPNPMAKSKMAAGLLGVFLGCYGVHNFYLGYTTKAVIQLVLTIVGLLLSCIYIGLFLIIGIQIWGLIEGIMILTGRVSVDGKGVPLKE